MNSSTTLQERPELETQMSLFDHLDELRGRLVKSALAILLCSIIATIFTTEIIDLLIKPYGIELRTHGPTEGITTYFRVAFMTGFTIAVPFVFYQFLMFILPGLERNEKKYIALSLPAATFLFLTGVGFAWFIMIPAAIGFLSSFQKEVFVQEWQAREYIPFVTSMIFWIGISFETPLVIFILAKVGLVTPQFLIKQWRFAIVLIAIAAAVITPTVDPFNMGLVMLPLIVLYGISILLSYFA